MSDAEEVEWVDDAGKKHRRPMNADEIAATIKTYEDAIEAKDEEIGRLEVRLAKLVADKLTLRSAFDRLRAR